MIEIILTGFFLLIAALGLLTTVRAALITTTFALTAFFMLAIKEIQNSTPYSWELSSFILVIFYMIIFYLLIAKMKTQYEKHLNDIHNMEQNFDLRIGQINQSNQDIKRNNQELTKKASELSLIYNSIKNMSSTLDFFETLKSFCNDLNEMANFQKGRLILINRDNDEKNTFQIESVYKLNSIALNLPVYEVIEKTEYDFTITELLLKSKKEKLMESTLIFEKESELKMAHPVFSKREVGFPMSLFPLEVKNEILGILITEGIEKDNNQKVNIIINHFAMEIKKIHLYEKLKSLSLIDGLTGLYLRRHFIKRLEEEMERVSRNKGLLSLMMFDIDDFKNFNDKYGHLAGDIVLKETSNIIKSNSREIDLIGRYGGDEIIMALPMTDPEKTREIAERIRKMVEQHRFSTTYSLIHATISTGIACYPAKDIKTSLDLITAADSALYSAKRKGKNTIIIK